MTLKGFRKTLLHYSKCFCEKSLTVFNTVESDGF